MTLPLILTIAAAVAAAALWLSRRRRRPREVAMAQLLDAADALEGRLRTARDEIEAIAGTEDNRVRDALQEMLRQRLWLQQHGADASLEQLRTVRASIDAARLKIDRQLHKIERARAPLL